MIDRQSVINAFAKTPHPGDHSLCKCDCDECQWEIATFKSKRWSRLGLTDFCPQDGNANVALLTAEAFHYFLPGLVLLTIDNPGADWLVGRIVNRFTVSDQESDDRLQRVRKDISRLSPAQRQAMISVARHWQAAGVLTPVVGQSLIAGLHDSDVVPYSLAVLQHYNDALARRRGDIPGQT